MTRLALSKTLVSGTVTLQGIPYPFTASASGTATGSNVAAAKKAATVASNSAAVTAARASIDKILADNSAILSELEITSLISNNFTTTVKVFRPIAITAIASSTDGVNYTLKKNTTIGSDKWLTITDGMHFYTGKHTFKIDGYFQVGSGNNLPISGISTIDYYCEISGCVDVKSTGNLTITPSGTIDLINYQESTSNYFHNSGIVTNNGNVTCTTQYSNICTYGGSQFTNNGNITIMGTFGYLKNNSSAIFTNNGNITNYAPSTFVLNNGATFYNYGSIKNNGKYSYTCNSYGTWIGDGTITGTYCISGCTTCPYN